MTWEELCEKAKEIDASIDLLCEFFKVGNVYFCNNGEVYTFGIEIAKDRTPDQMLAIMKALQ